MTKAKTGYLFTVSIIIKPGAVTEDNCPEDWVSACLSENPEILDWAYVHHLGPDHQMYPVPIKIPDDYTEGDFLVSTGVIPSPEKEVG